MHMCLNVKLWYLWLSRMSSRSDLKPRWEEASGNPLCIGFDEDEKLLKSGSLESWSRVITRSWKDGVGHFRYGWCRKKVSTRHHKDDLRSAALFSFGNWSYEFGCDKLKSPQFVAAMLFRENRVPVWVNCRFNTRWRYPWNNRCFQSNLFSVELSPDGQNCVQVDTEIFWIVEIWISSISMGARECVSYW